MYVEVKSKENGKNNKSNEPLFDWRAVLYHGDNKQPLPINNVTYDYTNTAYSERQT